MLSPLQMLRALFRSESPAARPRLAVEALDDRIVPAFDIAVSNAHLIVPTAVGFDYTATDPATEVTVWAFRSADATFDSGDELVGGNIITTPEGGGSGAASIGLFGELELDPARDFVLVVADPSGQVEETNEDNNTSSFRKVAFAALAHGFTLTGLPPAWLETTAAQMRAEGYEYVLPFVWTPMSQLPIRGGTVLAGQVLAQVVRDAAPYLTGPNDVMDVHLIGHSRGTAVVSQAFESLTRNPGPDAVELGFFKQTLLDPHVARNFGPLAVGRAEVRNATGIEAVSSVGQFSFDPSRLSSRAYAQAVLNFQALANDPPAFVPAAVDQAEVYFQRLPWNQTTFTIPGLPLPVEQITGLNFLAPTSVPNAFGRPVESINLNSEGVGHYEVPDWYRINVVPTLGG
jgi:hypothetical protein